MAEILEGCPTRRHGVTVRQMEDESWLLFDAEGGATHAVNATAAFIWNLCDGTRTVDQICSDVAEYYDADADLVRRDVEALLGEFLRLGLLQADGEPAGA